MKITVFLISAALMLAPPLTPPRPVLNRARHISGGVFDFALREARQYETEGVTAAVIPHHLAAAPMVGGLFKSLAESGAVFSTVVVVGPNHTASGGDVVLSLRDWDTGAKCDTVLMEKVQSVKLNRASVTLNDKRMEDEHSVSVMMPFISHFWPEARVAPILLSRALSFEDAMLFAKALNGIINEYGAGPVLLICSIDFSHDLTPAEAASRDLETLAAVENFDYRAVYGFSNANIDSPAAMVVFLKYLEANGLALSVIDRADASAFLGPAVRETTSYMVMTGVRVENSTIEILPNEKKALQ